MKQLQPQPPSAIVNGAASSPKQTLTTTGDGLLDDIAEESGSNSPEMSVSTKMIADRLGFSAELPPRSLEPKVTASGSVPLPVEIER